MESAYASYNPDLCMGHDPQAKHCPNKRHLVMLLANLSLGN
jgi:hypothetical protein